MNRGIFRQISVIVTFIFAVTMNGLATGLPLNGMDTATISDMFSNYFTPAGYVFSIWGVIYLGLAAFTVYQALPSQRDNPRLVKIGWLFVVSNLLNASWILAWHYLLFPLSWVIMIGLLVTLLTIYTRLGIGKRPASGLGRWVINVPFSIYTAWICVATIANTTTFLQALGFNGGPIAQPIWSAAILVVATVIAGYVAYTRRDVAYVAVFVWAFAGIVVKYMGTVLVAYTAGITAGVIVAVLIAGLLTNRPSNPRLQGNPV